MTGSRGDGDRDGQQRSMTGRTPLLLGVSLFALLILMLPQSLLADESGTRSSDDICDGGECHSTLYDMWVEITSFEVPSSVAVGGTDRVEVDVDVSGKSNWRLYEDEYECSLEVFVAGKYGYVEVDGSPAEDTRVLPGYTDTFRFDIEGVEEGTETIIITVKMSNSNHNIAEVSDSVEADIDVEEGSGGSGGLPAPDFHSKPASPDDDGDFHLQWSSVDGADGYILERDTTSFFTGSEEIYSGSSTSYDVTGLQEGTYYFRVQANSGDGGGSWSDPIQVLVRYDDDGGDGGEEVDGDDGGDGGDGEEEYDPGSGSDDGSTPGFGTAAFLFALLSAFGLLTLSGWARRRR